jgi:hypothetical protein
MNFVKIYDCSKYSNELLKKQTFTFTTPNFPEQQRQSLFVSKKIKIHPYDQFYKNVNNVVATYNSTYMS